VKRYLVFVSVIGMALVGVVFLQAVVKAEEPAPMTEAHIERIRSNCIEAQSSLNQLHASDALLRVNRGQLYESISTKLMAPFNSRVALNHLDSAGLPAIASQYEQQLATFRLSYQQYEEAMSRTLKINCTNQPVAFYDSLGDTRTKREAVHASTVELHKTIQNYKAEFEAFAKKFLELAK
jgi:hypothetical protein